MADGIERRTMLALGAAAGAMPALAEAAQTMNDYPTPGLEFVFQADVELGPIEELGTIDGIRRRIVPIVGGTVKGPRLNGRVMPGGADWQGIRAGDGLTRVFAHYWLKADDGQAISVQNSGLRRAPPAVMQRMMAGEIVPPGAYYFRACPSFEVGDGPHRWLNETVFICVGARLPNKAIVRVYAVT
ncbi:DUF3237 domain-containing protein [Sphingomonas sp. Y38-1Y]|uniref:DUF3237 domain-containing protein n=1 Tax=Sphingomonas sp. Y38-1Y TaxID=3078265 RepID=UPI0028E79730|nr:DUF3237 domain-containing protein [Sphingomonas sp. Y38-1Y]